MQSKINAVVFKHLMRKKVHDAEPLENDAEEWRTASEGYKDIKFVAHFVGDD